MTTSQVASAIDHATARRLSARFNLVFETLEAGDDLFAPDVLFDLNMPVWRFQLQGPKAWEAQLRELAEGPIHVQVLRTAPTDSGFVTEHEERGEVHGRIVSARRMWLCEVRDGLIAEVVGYCSGEWDEELRARHAREAPMIRPEPLDPIHLLPTSEPTHVQ